MAGGIAATFRVLTELETEAAGRVVVAAMGSSRRDIQEAAMEAALSRRNPIGQREILRRWPALDETAKQQVRQRSDRMLGVLREAILSDDPALSADGCRAAVWLQEYDLIPTLLNGLRDELQFNGDLRASSLVGLAEQLYQELASPEPGGRRRDPQLMRQHVISSLETGVQRYPRHRRREVIEAFLLLVHRDNVTLKQILQDPHHSAYAAVMDTLMHSVQPGVIRLLLSFLDDPHAPSAAISLIGNRGDPAMVRYLLKRVGRELGPLARQNLKRINQAPWLQAGSPVLAELDEAGQAALVRFAAASGVSRPTVYAIVEQMLRTGKPAGRRAAAEALEEFEGSDADELALLALDDPDPSVQAAIIPQLRGRGVSGALARVVDLVESRHWQVRQAARKALGDFSFKRFLPAFDMLDEDVRRSTGALVKKVDRQTLPLLRNELRSRVRTRRLRGLAMARAMNLASELETQILELLHDEDHLIRVEAAGVLADCASPASYEALEDALNDRSPLVQEAARKSLEARSQYSYRDEIRADPRD